MSSRTFEHGMELNLSHRVHRRVRPPVFTDMKIQERVCLVKTCDLSLNVDTSWTSCEKRKPAALSFLVSALPTQIPKRGQQDVFGGLKSVMKARTETTRRREKS